MSKNTMRGSVAAALVAVLAAAYFLGGVRSPNNVAAQSPSPTPTPGVSGVGAIRDTVSVGGIGRIAGTPDTLQLQLQVESRGADVTKAMNGATDALQKVVASLKSNGVGDADRKTSGLSINANYNYDNNTQTLIDYTATQSLTVKLRDLDKAGAAISAAVTAGGNAVRINGVSLDLEGNSALVVDARAAAFADAKAKAEQYAKLSGRTLGAVATVTEQVQDSPPVPVYDGRAVADAAVAKSVPIERGSQEVAVHVQVVWTLQ